MFDDVHSSIKIDWEGNIKRIYREAQDDLKGNTEYQEYLLEKYTTLPTHERERAEIMEASALGFSFDENGILKDNRTKKIASDNDVEKLEHNIQKVMLSHNPLMDEEVVKWDGTHFVLKPYREWRRIHEDRMKTELKPTPFSKEAHEEMIAETIKVNAGL